MPPTRQEVPAQCGIIGAKIPSVHRTHWERYEGGRTRGEAQTPSSSCSVLQVAAETHRRWWGWNPCGVHRSSEEEFKAPASFPNLPPSPLSSDLYFRLPLGTHLCLSSICPTGCGTSPCTLVSFCSLVPPSIFNFTQSFFFLVYFFCPASKSLQSCLFDSSYVGPFHSFS